MSDTEQSHQDSTLESQIGRGQNCVFISIFFVSTLGHLQALHWGTIVTAADIIVEVAAKL